MSSKPTIHHGRRYDVERLKFLGVCESAAAPCWLCGRPIDYTAAPQTDKAWEWDHARPVSTHPELIFEPSNYRASHSSCNRSRGDTAVSVAVRGTCRIAADW